MSYPLKICWLANHYLADLVEIERTSAERPLTVEELRAYLRNEAVSGHVAVAACRPVGYVCYEMHRHSLQLLRVVVDREFRRRRVGLCLLNRVVVGLHMSHRSRIVATLRESDLPMQLFLRAQGFRADSHVLRGHFKDTGEDAYVMRYTVPQEARETG